MSLIDLGKNDISEETQALKDKLASRDTENAGLRTQLMRREAELEELRATFNETVYKLSKEAERALQLEGEVSARSCELKTERISLQNTELALQSAQEKLKAEERAKRELESTLDTVSLHSLATSAEHQSVQREKHALESRVRELERIVQTHESKGVTGVPRKNGRPRSSSVSNFRLPAVEQELSDVKTQLHNKDTRLRVLEQKLAEAQSNLVMAENARISIDKASQERISELLLTLERREEEVESLKETDNSGEREEQLLQRIDEDAAKIAALEKLVAESQAARPSQTRLQKLQSQLKAECEKVQRSEGLRDRLLQEKAELLRQYEASQREVGQGHELLRTHELRIREMEGKHAHLLTELDTYRLRKEPLSYDAERHPSQAKRLNGVTTFPDESALADHIQTLLQAIDRLRDERDGLKRALAFSEVEYRITTESFQTRIAFLTGQLARNTHDITSNAYMEQKMKRLVLCATAFTVVISNLQTRLDLSKDHLSSISVDLTSSNSQLRDALAIIDGQNKSFMANTHEHDVLLQKLDVVTKERAESEEERCCLRLQLADSERQVVAMTERVIASEAAREEAHESFLLAEQRFATLDRNYHDVESERNSLALQITNLQDDLARLQNELADTQNRYNTLHAQQLSEMTTSEVVRTLKDRIKELEARIVHCNDQIGDYQHDIRRLEANVKLQEERIAELTSELELLASQKEAMVEDCAEAREARDGAIERSEAAEEKAERFQQQLQQAKHAHEGELSATFSMVESLTSEKKWNTERIASLEVENAGLTRELDILSGNHHRLGETLDTAVSRSRSSELENPEERAEIQQAVISLAVIHRAYRGCTRQLQRSYRHTTSLESQLDVLVHELEKRSLIDNAEDISTTIDRSQDDPFSPSNSRTSIEDPSCTCGRSQQRETQQDHNVDSLHKSLQEKELELVTARQSLEEAKSRYAVLEAGLLERITTMTTELSAQPGQAEDIASLRMELENVRMQLQNSMENFADLEELHNEVIQDFISVKEIFEHRLSETDKQIRKLEADHQRSLTTMETKYRHEADILTSNLEDREHDMEELREQLRDMSEAHAHLERKLHEELKAYELSHALANSLENDLRRTVADMRQRLVQAEAETLTLQEERRLLQEQITGLQAEIQRSMSLTRYLESQVRESEDACMLLKERLQRSELTLAESEKAGKAAEFNLTLQTTQQEKVVAALRREIASLQRGPELRSALVDLEEKNREMDDLLRAKCQEIEEYDDRILETLKSNKRLTSKVDSLTRKVQALQTRLSSMKKQSQELVAEATPPQKASSTSNPPIPCLVPMDVASYPSSSRTRESSDPSPTLRSKAAELRPQPAIAAPPSRTPGRAREPSGCEFSTGKKRPAPDDDERDSVPAEGHYSADAYARSGPTPRLRRVHGHPGGFTPVRGATLRKPAAVSSPGRRVVAGVTPSEVITDVTNSPRGGGDAQLKKRSWLGKIRSGQPASSRLGAFGGR